MKPIALLLATTMAFSPAVTCAQQAANTPVAVAQATAATTATSSSPLSLARVQRQLLATEVGKPTEGDHIRIEEFINVYGKSIALDVMRDYDVKATAVQYGGMTHTEFLDVVTPQMFRQPTVDFVGLALGAAKWAVTRAAEKRKKAEQERIALEAEQMRIGGVIPPR